MDWSVCGDNSSYSWVYRGSLSSNRQPKSSSDAESRTLSRIRKLSWFCYFNTRSSMILTYGIIIKTVVLVVALVERCTRDRKVACSTLGRGAIKSTRSTQPSIPLG